MRHGTVRREAEDRVARDHDHQRALVVPGTPRGVVEIWVGISHQGLAGEEVESIEAGGIHTPLRSDDRSAVGYGSGGRCAQCHSMSQSSTPSTRSWRVAICQPPEPRTATSW